MPHTELDLRNDFRKFSQPGNDFSNFRKSHPALNRDIFCASSFFRFPLLSTFTSMNILPILHITTFPRFSTNSSRVVALISFLHSLIQLGAHYPFHSIQFLRRRLFTPSQYYQYGYHYRYVLSFLRLCLMWKDSPIMLDDKKKDCGKRSNVDFKTFQWQKELFCAVFV